MAKSHPVLLARLWFSCAVHGVLIGVGVAGAIETGRLLFWCGFTSFNLAMIVFFVAAFFAPARPWAR